MGNMKVMRRAFYLRVEGDDAQDRHPGDRFHMRALRRAG
jgi:hypothetical protein